MNIHIESLKFQTIIGILDFERTNEQDVIVNILINYDYTSEFINYADVSEYIKLQMQENKFLLIEDALFSLSKGLKQKFTLINTLDIKITKPSILPECIVSVSNSYKFNS